MEDYPNVVIIPPNDETPEEIIEDYEEMFRYNLERGISIKEMLYMFFEEINIWTCKEFLIDQAKQSLHELENLQQYVNETEDED